MFDFNDPSIVVQMCKFQALIQKAHIVIKFPCSYFVEWKTINNRYSICTQKRVRTANDQAMFHQKLTFYTQMVYNTKTHQYYSKETFLLLNLVSKSRPDQVKLVGRISVDLADVLNRRRFEEVSRMKLNYCSVEGSIVFGISLLNKRDSNLSVKDLDRSAFTDYFSLNPINRMMIEESINGNLAHNNQNNQNSPNRSRQNMHRNDIPQQNGYNNPKQHQYFREQSHQQQTRQGQQLGSIPTFNHISEQSANNKKHETNPASSYRQYQQMEQEVISFKKSQRQERFVAQSPRTNYSREQSLIQKLQQKNLKASEKEYQKKAYHQHQATFQKGPNVVQVNCREPRTQRLNQQNNSNSNYSVGNKARLLNRVEEQAESGQIRRQQGVISKVGSQSKLQGAKMQTNTVVSKPTSPPSYERQIANVHSSSKFSETSEYQNEQLMSIVEKLQHQKQEQESMIQSLKSMLVNKNMKKKQKGSHLGEDSQTQGKLKEVIEENVALRNQNDGLMRELEKKGEEVRQKSMHVFELLDKIKKLQGELVQYDQKIRVYEQQIGELHMKEIENEKACESLKLSLTMQPGYDNLVKARNGMGREENKEMGREEEVSGVLSKKSSKLLDSFKTGQYLQNQIQVQKKVQSQQPETVEFKILITKDEKIYEQIQQENHELIQRVNQLQEEIAIYKDLLKQQNTHSQQFKSHQVVQSKLQHLRESIPIVQPVADLDADEVPFTITVSKNINIYEDYQNLSEENTELYQRINDLEHQIQSYKELIRDMKYPEVAKQQHDNVMVESVQVQDIGQYYTTTNKIKDVASSHPSANPSQLQDSANIAFETNPCPEMPQQPADFSGEIFKIILTKDKNIYQEQQQQNIQLSKRVIELQQQIDTYKQLLKNDQQPHSFTEPQTATKSKQDHYQNEGLTITLTKDNNIFENQEQQITEYEQQVAQLESIIQKYKTHYGPINHQPQYKVSITREDRIYDDQEQQISELLKSIQDKDDQLIQLMKRLSWLERQSDNSQAIGETEIKINIRRDQNIYHDQENDITDLTQKVHDLQANLHLLNTQLTQKDSIIQTLKTHQTTTTTHKASEFIPLQLSCLACVSLQNRILQLETSEQLIEDQKNMLEQELGVLEEEKFCLTSTENQLKITIQDLRDQINLLGQQNERLSEELHFVQQNYHLEHNGSNQHQENANDDHEEGLQKGVHEEVFNRSKFSFSLPEHVFSQYSQANVEQQSEKCQKRVSQRSRSPTNHLQQLPQSPRSRESQQASPQSAKLSKLLQSLQQQNSHLRQSLSTFEQQLEQQYVTIGELQQRIARLMHEKELLFERDQELSKEIIVLSEKEQDVNEREMRFRVRISELEKQLTALKAHSLSMIGASHVMRRDESELGSLKVSDHQNKLRVNELETQVQLLKQQLKAVNTALSAQHGQLIQKDQQLRQKEEQLIQKEEQIEQLQRQLQSLNQSLFELSASYQSLQKNIFQLQEQKQSQVESIRQEYDSMNQLLKKQLQSIQNMIVEKQQICDHNQLLIDQKTLQIDLLTAQIAHLKNQAQQISKKQTQQMSKKQAQQISEMKSSLALLNQRIQTYQALNADLAQQNNQLRNSNTELIKQNDHLSSQVSHLTQSLSIMEQQAHRLTQQITRLQQLKPQIPLSPQQLNYKHNLYNILREVQQSRLRRDVELSELIPLVTQKLNSQQFVFHSQAEERLARMIAKEVQKIKINIMRNYQTSANTQGGFIQKTVPIKTGYNQEFKTFAEKSAMLNYLKPIQDLIKAY